jgi:hypothetical protein
MTEMGFVMMVALGQGTQALLIVGRTVLIALIVVFACPISAKFKGLQAQY